MNTKTMATNTARAAGLPDSAADTIATEWDCGSSTEEAIGYAAAATGCDAAAAVETWNARRNAPLTETEQAEAARIFG